MQNKQPDLTIEEQVYNLRPCKLDAKCKPLGSGAATTIVSSDLTVSRALTSNGSGKV